MSQSYLRYVSGDRLGVVTSKKGECRLIQGRKALTPALHDLVLWDTKTSTKVCTLSGEGSEVSAVCVSGDGVRVAVGRESGCVEVWGLQVPSLIVSLRGHKSGITCVRFDESATRLISGSKDTDIVVWDLITEAGLFRLKGHRGPITDARIIDSKNVLITSSRDGAVKLWDLDTQHCFQTVVGHRGEVLSLEVLCGGTTLVTASGHHRLRVFSLSEQQEEGGEEEKVPMEAVEGESIPLEGREKPVFVRADHSGGYLATLTTDSTVRVFGVVAAGGSRARKRARKATPLFKLISSFKSKVKARSCDIAKYKGQLRVLLALQNNSVEVYVLEEGMQWRLLHAVTSPGHRGDIRTVCFSSDDDLMLSGSSTSLKVWKRATLKCVCTLNSDYALCSTFIPGNRHVAIGTKSGSVGLFELSSSECVEEVAAHDGPVWSVCVTPDNRGLLSGSADKTVKFWEFELLPRKENQQGKRLTMNHVKTLVMSEDVLALCCSPDQRLVAVALLDTTVKVFFADTLKLFLSLYGHKLPVLSLDISSDASIIATCSADKNIRIWGLDFGDCHKSIFAHDDSIQSVRFVPDTHLLFSASKDSTVKCWDTDNYQLVQTLKGHIGEVWCMAISNDGSTVLTGSHDCSLRLWERTQEPLVLSEEREMERENYFEQLSGAEVSEAVIPGEKASEASLPHTKTQHTIAAVDRLLEAVQLWKTEKDKMLRYNQDCKDAGKKLPLPEPHPMLVARGNVEPKKYVLDTLRRIRSSELEDCLLVMPFDQVILLFELLDMWLQAGWEVELCCRCLFFLMRVHHTQIVLTSDLQPLVSSLSLSCTRQVKKIKDVYGFNLEALKCVQSELTKREAFGAAPVNMTR